MPAQCGKTWETVGKVWHRCTRQKKRDGSPHDGECSCPCGKHD